MERVPEFIKIGCVGGVITVGNSIGLYLLSIKAPALIVKACALSTAGLLLTTTGLAIWKFSRWL
jgi:hypothetical protein